MAEPKKGDRINVTPDGTIVGTGGAAATNYGPDSTPIRILDQENRQIGTTTLGEVRKKLGLK